MLLSPSSRRAWIEIAGATKTAASETKSPSSRRAWIEMQEASERHGLFKGVALLAEGVDRNIHDPSKIKYKLESPSSRRAWIEIKALTTQKR